MADFDPPFADQGERRAPLSTEQQLGWPCGPASRELFNYLFWLQQGQIKSIADEAGVGSEQSGDHTVLKRAVLELINAAIAQLDPPEDPDLSAFVTINQARSRLPIFPEVLHSDGHLGVFSPSIGTVRLPAGRDFLHRGIGLVTTPELDLNTDASKTYHLRWNRNDGFVLRDLASGTYNPGTLEESNSTFDSTFDDMLVARVIANSSNAVSVTNLQNRSDLWRNVMIDGTDLRLSGQNGANILFQDTFNWARTPKNFSLTTAAMWSHPVDTDELFYDPAIGRNPTGSTVPSMPVTRYGLNVVYMRDGMNAISSLFLNARA